MYCTNPAENVASASAVLEVDDRLPHGRYAAPRAPLPYEPAFTGTPKAWPPETLYTRSAARNETYISDYRTLPASNTFGKPAHAKTLKTTLAEHGQSPPRHPLPSAALCSKTAPLVSGACLCPVSACLIFCPSLHPCASVLVCVCVCVCVCIS